MSISKLATDTMLSPHYYSGRKYPITRVTIHHMASVMTGRACAAGFMDPARKASANYCVGYDGSICCSVDEANAAWTSSSYDNDNRAITIEVANSSRGGNWPVGEKAMSALLDLLVDICKRNPGIGRLNYTGDTTGNMTLHNMFTYTVCPGAYLQSKMSWIASQVNSRLGNQSTTDKSETTEQKPAEKVEDTDNGMTKIMGTSRATLDQMTARLLKANPNVPQSVIDMLPYYLTEGAAEGVRGDIAFAQSCIETGNFAFPKNTCNVDISQNNFAMMGVTGTWAVGNSYPTPQIGIRAQIQHLKAYACKDALNGACVDPRFGLVRRGSAEYVEWLGTQENPQGAGWAGAKGYGSKILRVLEEILAVEVSSKPVEREDEPTYIVSVDGLTEEQVKALVAGLEADGYDPTVTVKENGKVEEKPVETPKQTLKILDMVRMQKGAPVWGLGRAFQSWVYNKDLYVRNINGDRITVSIYRSGAITGDVDVKYLTKV